MKIQYEQRKRRMLDYLKLKLEEEDWHGVQDAASDLRDIESEQLGFEAAIKLHDRCEACSTDLKKESER